MIAEVCPCRHGLLVVTDLENVYNELRFHIEHKEHYPRLYEIRDTNPIIARP